jgi:hypothetical protein
MKTLLMLVVSIVYMSAFATSPKKVTRKPSQAPRAASTLKSTPKLDGNCLIDYTRVLYAKNEVVNLNAEQKDYMEKALETAKKVAKDTQMSNSSFETVISSQLFDLSYGSYGAKVSLCDDKERGQANCLDVYFASTQEKPSAPRLSVVSEEWHTAGTSFYPVCQY